MEQLKQIAVYPAGQVWSDWVYFPRSSNVAAARYKLDHSGTWQVMFGGKPKRPTKRVPNPGEGVTALSLYQYGPSDVTTEANFWRWYDQYAAGGSAGIWLNLHVKMVGVPYFQVYTQGA